MADLYDFPEIYDERFTDAANNAYRQHYEKMFHRYKISDILDCSFGTGNLTFELCELGYKVWGSDLSETMLSQAEKKAKEKGFDVPLTCCDFRELSNYYDRQFDCVMSTGNALAHVNNSDVKKTLREMDKLVKPGGYLYLDTRNWDKEMREHRHMSFANPYLREDGSRINYAQMWEYPADGSVRINILYGYEKDNNIYKQETFTERLIPFGIDLIKETLLELGYGGFVVKPLPYFSDMEFMEMGWYCLVAQKMEKSV